MGTIGGKIGFVVGVVVAFVASFDLARLIFGSCFLEEGCPNEGVGFVAVATVSIVLALVGGLLVRELVNRLLRETR